jgi:hypothetical protein
VILVVVVLAAMTLSDSFDSAHVMFLEDGRRLLAGLCDWAKEVGDLCWIGGPTAAFVKSHYRLTWLMAWVFAAMLVGSLTGAELGSRVEDWVNSRLRRVRDKSDGA